ncbi:MAG TPA: glucosaminidase domain-containing protein [Flavipsychrobacter sp.]|nr:glucosaminidase domain-containing protein [Flavipsychrobacter sp.]
MQKWLVACISILFCVSFKLGAQDTYADKVNKYISQYKKLAIAEQGRSGIPAAVTLGQGILETQAGCSELVTGACNHFGIKCKSNWTGQTYSYTDDAPNECFRKYKCAEDSYKDHSDYLKGSPRYASLFQLSPTDYAAWATGLKRCGYATNPHYAKQLIDIIENFHLQQYTYAALNGTITDTPDNVLANNTAAQQNAISSTTPANTEPAAATTVNNQQQDTHPIVLNSPGPGSDVMTVNGLKAIHAFKGDMLLKYAVKYNIRYEKLLEYNDLPDAPLTENTIIYLEKKKTRGTDETYVVKPGETLQEISQAEGIQLKRLMNYNHINPGEEPIFGSVLQLQQFTNVKPEVTTIAGKKPSKIIVTNDDGSTNQLVAHSATASQSDYITKEDINNQAPSNGQVLPYRSPVQNAPQAPQDTASIAQAPTTQAIAPPSADAKKADDNVYTASADTNPVIEKKDIEPQTDNTSTPVVTTSPQSIAVTTTPVTDKAKDDNGDNTNDNKTATNNTQPTQQSRPFNIMNEKAIDDPGASSSSAVAKGDDTTHATVSAPEGPQPDKSPESDLARLKAQLDKVVYADDDASKTSAAPVPTAAPETKTDKPAESGDTGGKPKYYTVKKGDTAFSIAKQNSITIHQLMDMNKLDFDEIKIGQRLRVK